MVYTVSDPKIEGTSLAKVPWQGLLLECGLAVDRRSAFVNMGE